jgi:radical SAM protein with 4Fe4S-binding SPASM domain
METIKSYSDDPYTTSFGAKEFAEKLHEKYGERYVKYREDWKRSEKFELLDFPINLVIDPIDACSLSCPQCLRAPDLIGEYAGYVGTNTRLTLEQIIAILDEGQQHGLPSVNLGGSGECLLHPDILQICQAVLDREVMELRVVSNGTQLTEEISEALIDMQIPVLSVSIDAFSPESYQKVRGKFDKYQAVVDNVLRFLEIRKRKSALFPLLRVSFVKQPANIHEKNDFLEFWSRRADMVDLQVYHDWRTTDYQTDFSCSEPWRRLMIWAVGSIGPCCGFPGIVYEVGRVGKQSLQEVWRGKAIEEIRTMLKEKAYRQPCLRCQGTRQKDIE